MMGPKLKRQPVASTSQAPKRKRKHISSSSSEEDISILDMVQTRSAKKKAEERQIISESSETEESVGESLDESEILSDDETSENTDQIISDDSNESTIATRSKRRVNRVNYSDEKYFRSRLGTDPDAKRKKDEAEKNRFGIFSSRPNNNNKNNRSSNLNKRNFIADSAYKKSKHYEESDDDEDLKDDNLPESSEENSDQDPEDDDSESESLNDQSKPIIDPISSTRANNSQFIAAHLDWCKKCGGTANRYHTDKGPLVLCEYCSNSYHLICYSKKTTNSKIICQNCNKPDSHLSRCMVCHNEPDNKEKNSKCKSDEVNLDSEDSQVFFRCLNCSQAIHESCMPFLNGEKTLQDKLKSYRESWKCHLCLKWVDKIDKILTYRKLLANNHNEGSMEVSRSQDTLQSEDINADSDNIEDYEFLVKFEDVSYLQVEWVPGPWLYGVSQSKYNNYVRSQPEPLAKEEVIQSNWTKIHRILDVQFKNELTLRDQLVKGHKILGRGTPVQAYIKWKGLNYADATWEPIKNLNKRKYEKAYQIRKNSYSIGEPDIFVNRTFVPHAVQPAYLKNRKHDNTLKDYQLDGVNWLLHNWCNEISCILADEMGLGKTIQIIVFILILYRERKCHPFLVVAPKSTTAGWSREFKRWARELNVIEYHGDKESVKVVEDVEMFPDGTNLKCHVVITTPEAIQKHTNTFSKVPLWEVLVVDEAHNLKRGEESILFKTLNMKFDVYHKVLLTGTPMMNCIDELFNLLKFLGHKEFENPKELAEEYQGLPSVDQLPALHKLLKTYFLRRTKSQVNLGLPPMDDVIVRVSMTPIQKTIYKETFEKNADFLKHVSRPNRSTGFSNILMSLRQIVCHPYLINREEIDPTDERTAEQEEERKKKLVETSGKLILLRDMLIKLHGMKHRVLIFSQFVSMLSIFEELLEDLGYKYVKLDGSTDNEVRQHNINAFQAPDSDIFVFLLSTRAGGVGLNLMAADTVFIYDPDFNPHQDIQALSRVHRIGQFKPVKVFRFITQYSIEEKIVEKGKIKLAKNELVVEKMDNEVLDVQEVDDIIRYGATALFSEDENENPVGLYTDEAVEKLLDRSQMKAAEQVTESKNLTGFAFARIWDTKTQEIVEENIIANVNEEESVESRDFWTKLLAHVANATDAEAPLQGRGARKRNKVDYYEGDITTPRKKQGKKRSIDPDFIPVDKEEDIISSETETDEDFEDFEEGPNVLDMSSKPVSSKGILSKRKDDGHKSKRPKQSSEDIYMNDVPMVVTGSGFQNITIPPIYQSAVGSTSYNHEVYNFTTQSHYYQWCYFDYYQQQQQMQIMQQPQQPPQQATQSHPNIPPHSSHPNTPSDKQIMAAVDGTSTQNNQNISAHGSEPKSSMQLNVSAQHNTSAHHILSQSNTQNRINVSIQPAMPIQPEHPNSQSQVQRYQPRISNIRSKSTNLNIRDNADTPKKRASKTSSLKPNGQQTFPNLQEPVVIISDDEIEVESRKLSQNRERKTIERSIASTSELSRPANMRTPNGSKNKGKQVVSNTNYSQKGGHNSMTLSTSTNNNQSQNANKGSGKIGEFVRLFDEIQMSDEDFGLRLIAITRLYHKLNSLGYDIENHITLLAAKGKLDHDLLKSFRNA